MQLEAIEILVIDAKQGDKRALELLYQHFWVPMRRFAAIRVNDPMVAEDLVQNVWLKVGKRIHQLNDVSLFRSWLYRALRWEILDWAKAPANHNESPADQHGAEPAASDINLQNLVPVLAALNSEERDVVELYYLNGLSLDETALALAVPAGTIKSRLFRARNHLRNTLYSETDNED